MTINPAVEVRELAEAEIERIERAEPEGQGFVRAMWELQRAGDSVLLVAWYGGDPVGSGQLDLRTSPVELKNLNVSADFRGQGIGASILRVAERRLAPGESLGIGVGDDNPRARALYERLGFRATGRFTTTTYEYLDHTGTRRQATETDELLVKQII